MEKNSCDLFITVASENTAECLVANSDVTYIVIYIGVLALLFQFNNFTQKRS